MRLARTLYVATATGSAPWARKAETIARVAGERLSV
jgi:hypothetical protein